MVFWYSSSEILLILEVINCIIINYRKTSHQQLNNCESKAAELDISTWLDTLLLTPYTRCRGWFAIVRVCLVLHLEPGSQYAVLCSIIIHKEKLKFLCHLC